MSREPILSADDAAPAVAERSRYASLAREDDLALRPQRMEDMVGQRDVYERLKIAVDAARIRSEPLGHILLDGPPGLGKTTFATCIPRALDVPLQIASGAALTAPKDLLPYLTNAEEGSVLFIDEIHRLPKAVEEFMYPAMEDFRVDITLGEGMNARTVNMSLRPFTIIGATTRSGLLSAPLRDRFQVREHLDFYSHEELQEIIRRNARKLRMDIDDAAAEKIAVLQPRHAADGQQSPALGPRLRHHQGRRHDHAARSPRRRSAMLGVDQLGLDGAGPQVSGHDPPRVPRRPGGRRGGRPHAQHGDRHADRRGRAVPAAGRAGGPHAARPQADGQGLRAPRRHPAKADESLPLFGERGA